MTHSDTPAHRTAPARVRAALAAARTRAWVFRRRRPLLAATALALVLVLALAVGDVGLMSARLGRTEVRMPHAIADAASTGSANDETWLVVGTDSREALPAGPDRYGTVEDTGGGSRADVLALVRPTADGLTVLALPRDLTIGPTFLTSQRLATSYLDGAQNTVDLLCTQLGITTTHLITVDMAQFASIIDSLGGVEVDIPEPVRDAYTGLNLTSAGHHRLSGIDALALVRSRHPEILRDGSWVAMSQADGAQRRSQSTATVMQAVLSAIGQRASNPISLHQLAHTVAGNITLDSGTGLADLVSLGRSASKAGRAGTTTVIDLPTGPRDESIIVSPNQESRDLLAGYGYTPKTCRPAGA